MRIFIVLLFSFFLTICAQSSPSYVEQAQGLQVKNNSPVTVLKGTRPIIVSAPHAMEVPRGKGKVFADTGTGELAIMLHKLCDVTVIYLSSTAKWNPNASHDNIYKETLQRLILTEQPKLVIDLHRSRKSRSFDIDYGTLHGISCSNKITEDLSSILKEKGMLNFSSNFFSASRRDTVTKWAHQHGVEAVQLEINGTWVDLEGDQEDLHRFSQLLQGLSTFLFSF